MILATAIMLWMAPVASAGMTCHQVGQHTVCNDDGGGQIRCGYVGNAYKCW